MQEKKLKTALDLPVKIEYCLELPLELSAHYEFEIIQTYQQRKLYHENLNTRPTVKLSLINHT